MRAGVDAGSERIYGLLPVGQRKTLRAVAVSGSIYGTAASLLELPPGTARNASQALIGNGFLHRDRQRPRVVGPVLTGWLCRRFS